MKYNDNGEYKDIYIKTFDTLPVGTEVDYDGETVPDGWSEVNNVLYNSTTGSNTSVTLSDSVDNYEYIEIYFGNQAKTRNSSIKLMKGAYNTQLKLINISNTSTQQNTQEYYKDINVSGTSITTNLNRALYITSAIGEYSTATITSSNDNLVYIYRVVGYK